MRFCHALVIVAVASLGSCKCDRKSEPVKDAGTWWVGPLVQRLQSPDEQVRKAALVELRKKGSLTAAEGVELLRATTLRFPDGGSDTPTELVRLVADEPRLEYLPLIKELFPRLDPSTREDALELLSGLDDAEAAATYLRLVTEHATELTSLPARHLQHQPHHPNVFFPGLLALASHPALTDDVYLTALTFCEKGLLPSAAFVGHTAPLVAASTAELDWLLPHQRPNGVGWIWEDEYQVHRERASLLLDLFGYLPMDAVEPELLRAQKFLDPRLVYFSVVSLLRQGREVPATSLDAVAASPEMRNWLFGKLGDMGKAALFPKAFMTQESFAESAMVAWLSYPTELGRPPDEIVLEKVVPADTHGDDGVLD